MSARKEEPHDRVLTDVEVAPFAVYIGGAENEQELERIQTRFMPRVVRPVALDFQDVRHEVRLHLRAAFV